MVPMTPVSSSNVRSLGYDSEASELWVAFNGGRMYVYSGVPEGVLEAALSAPSVGKFINENVKNVYEERRV